MAVVEVSTVYQKDIQSCEKSGSAGMIVSREPEREDA